MAQKLVEVLGVINDATGKIEGFVPAKIPGAVQSPVSGGGARTIPLAIATFGDSTANTGATTDYREVTPVFPGSGATVNSFLVTKAAVLNYYQRAVYVGNCGVSGDNTTQMLARDGLVYSSTRRAIADLLIMQPDVVLYRGGSINDIQTSVNNGNIESTAVAVIERHLSIVAKMVSLGLTVVDSGIFGYGAGSSAVSPTPDAVRACLLLINAGIKAGLSQYGNKARYLDTSGLTNDGTGLYYPALTVDGLHLSPLGGEVHGRAEAALLTEMFGPSSGRSYYGKLLYGDNYTSVAAGRPTTTTDVLLNGCTKDAEGVGIVDGYWAHYVDATITGESGSLSSYMLLPVSTMGVLAGERVGCEAGVGVESETGVTIAQKYHRLSWYDPTNTKRYISEVISGEEIFEAGGKSFFSVRHPPQKLTADMASFAGSSTRLEASVNFGAGQVGKRIRLYLTPPKLLRV